MKTILKSTSGLAAIAMLASPLTTVSAQSQDSYGQNMPMETQSDDITVFGDVPTDLSDMPEGPTVEGFISGRDGNRVRVTTADGQNMIFALSSATEIRSSGGFLGLDKDRLEPASLMSGLPVDVDTVQWGSNLVASKVAVKSKDLKTAAMIHNGTNERFEEQAAATEALRGRVGDIDKYNIKGTTNVYFDTGKYNLSDQARMDLCNAAQQANATDNALLLVVGYTDNTGNYEINQDLSEKRATRVVNYLQQQCDWAPYRMLTPTGMAESDPMASNDTEEGKAQNRRVAVNILVSKSVDGF
ncbi:OmpA family protein [Erythrobacter litoralis]|uniref:OmpA family protein n=1 Tax=Erythrobacter litoralis TaxID=39960 RepID=UPI00243487A3|nr:OmpA family protein [Erythrobacter litoralis]MDG6079008.1 OmpA family protein [Erythrobacter litoralis]